MLLLHSNTGKREKVETCSTFTKRSLSVCSWKWILLKTRNASGDGKTQSQCFGRMSLMFTYVCRQKRNNVNPPLGTSLAQTSESISIHHVTDVMQIRLRPDWTTKDRSSLDESDWGVAFIIWGIRKASSHLLTSKRHAARNIKTSNSCIFSHKKIIRVVVGAKAFDHHFSRAKMQR